MKTALTKKTTFLASLLVVAGAWTIQSCSGDDGSQGPEGKAGTNCSVQQTAAGAVVTCPGSEPVTITGGAGSDCRLTAGAGGQTITCGSNSAFISEGGVGSVDCKLVTADGMTMSGSTTGINGKGERQVFSIQCGNGSAAQIGFCGTYNDVFNPKTEKCVETTQGAGDWHIEAGMGVCAGTPYVMSEQFCQVNKTTAAGGNIDDEENGVSLQPVCATGSGYYGTDEFCFGYNKVTKSGGKIIEKCGIGNQQAVPFEQWQFCLLNAAGTAEAPEMRCGFKADSVLTTAGFNSVTAKDDGPGSFDNDSFCQDVSFTVLPLCGGLKFTTTQTCLVSNEIGQFCNNNSQSYSIFRSFCASQNDRVYALCDTSRADGGIFNPTTHFCYSADYGTNNTPNANEFGKLAPVCGARITVANTGATDTPFKLVHKADTAALTDAGVTYTVEPNVGYPMKEFCSAQDNEVHTLCNYVPRVGVKDSVYNTNTYTCNTGSLGSEYGSWYLEGKCGETLQSQVTYKVSDASCEDNKLYQLCKITATGVATKAYDGPVTTGYASTNTQSCAADGKVTCRATGALEIQGKVGCACPATLPNQNTAATPVCLAACASTEVFDPKGEVSSGVNTGKCVTATAGDKTDCESGATAIGLVNGQKTCLY